MLSDCLVRKGSKMSYTLGSVSWSPSPSGFAASPPPFTKMYPFGTSAPQNASISSTSLILAAMCAASSSGSSASTGALGSLPASSTQCSAIWLP